jgi:hypothetical protein
MGAVSPGRTPWAGHVRVSRVRHEPGQMNGAEAAYRDALDLRVLAGEVLDYRFEALKLRLADRTFWTPDFAVVAADGVLELHEVKGHMEDDAAVKLKVAAEQYPWFRVYLVRYKQARRQYTFNATQVR